MGATTKTTTRPRGRWARIASAALVALLGALALTAPSAAHAAPMPDIGVDDTVYIGQKQGHGGTGLFPIWKETPADLANPGEPDFWAYCVEHEVDARTGVTGYPGAASGFLGENEFVDADAQRMVFWVLAHGYPAMSLEEFGEAVGVPDIARNDAIEAVQYAIWRFTEQPLSDPDWSWGFETEDSEDAYWYLVNGAKGAGGMGAADFEVNVSISAPSAPQTAGSLVGPFTVSTDQAVVSVSVDPAVPVADESGEPVDLGAVVDGQQLYLDLRGSSTAGSATVTASAQGSSASGMIVSVPAPGGGAPTEGEHAQTIMMVAPSTGSTVATASAQWVAAPASDPVIGTSLVDAADDDRVLKWNGGTVIDTVSYQHLIPGIEYVVRGELMRKSDGTATGIKGSTTFVPSSASGSVDVTFVVPVGYAGESLVAFEWLFEGDGEVAVAEHADIEDAAQTVLVEKAPADTPVTVEPSGEPLVNSGSEPPVVFGALSLLCLAAGAAMLVLGRRRAEA